MSRPLDFIVFGIPRSGTKGLVRALNRHPYIYCAMERFGFRDDHSRIKFPHSFVDRRGLFDKHDLDKVSRIEKDLASKPDVRSVGNKLPRYYLALDHINREVPSLKNVWIYRSPFDFMQSWNRREESQKSRWRAGQVGLFGLLELFYCIQSVLRLPKDVLLFPYDSGLNRSVEPVLETCDYLGQSPDEFDRAAYEGQLATSPLATAHRRPPEPYELKILETLRVRDLDVILTHSNTIMLSQVSHRLSAYLEGIRPLITPAFDRAVQTCPNTAIQSYGVEFFQRNRREIAPYLTLTQGSATVGAFNRTGAYRRLGFLLGQRKALIRRITSLRFSGRKFLPTPRA